MGPGGFFGGFEGVEAGPYSSLLEVQNGNALLNGQSAASTYGLWSYFGNQGNTYSINNNTQFRVSAIGSRTSATTHFRWASSTSSAVTAITV